MAPLPTLPTPVAALALSGVVAAGVVFAVTGASEPERATTVSAAPADRSPDLPMPTIEAQPAPKKKKPVVQRAETYVEVYNNSGITGLAATTASRADAVGWNVVAVDNWYGTIGVSTVYFPPKMRKAGQMLARDLGIQRAKTAIDPMRLDRLTVILTADYA